MWHADPELPNAAVAGERRVRVLHDAFDVFARPSSDRPSGRHPCAMISRIVSISPLSVFGCPFIAVIS